MKQFIFMLTIIPLLFCGCRGSGIKSIEREDIFSIDIGPMEDQIALYNLGTRNTGKKPGLAMRDGFFYISDSNGAKVVSYNSYGDLLFMIYNEETNPAPVSLKIKTDNNIHVTRWAYPYPFSQPGELAVDSRKHIFVEDRLPLDQHAYDNENRALLDRTVLHFDSEGRFVEYLGREGIGGSAFPRINSLHTSINDELAVICRLSTGWNIYWFNSGLLQYLVQLRNNTIPVPQDWQGVYASVDNVTASPDSRKIYIKVDYYRKTIDESTNTHSGNEAYGSIIWILNIEDGSYTGSVRLPFFEINEAGSQQSIRLPYSILGAVKNERFFLYYPSDEGFYIMVVSANTQERRRGFIRVEPAPLQFNVFNLSADGLLSAMIVDDWKVSLTWWRTDRFIGLVQ